MASWKQWPGTYLETNSGSTASLAATSRQLTGSPTLKVNTNRNIISPETRTYRINLHSEGLKPVILIGPVARVTQRSSNVWSTLLGGISLYLHRDTQQSSMPSKSFSSEPVLKHKAC